MDDIKAKLSELWNGNVPLAQTFWLYYVVGVIIIRVIASITTPALGILIVAWAGFMVMPIWRSADKYNGNNLFALLAKVAAVIIAIGVIGTLF